MTMKYSLYYQSCLDWYQDNQYPRSASPHNWYRCYIVYPFVLSNLNIYVSCYNFLLSLCNKISITSFQIINLHFYECVYHWVNLLIRKVWNIAWLCDVTKQHKKLCQSHHWIMFTIHFCFRNNFTIEKRSLL